MTTRGLSPFFSKCAKSLCVDERRDGVCPNHMVDFGCGQLPHDSAMVVAADAGIVDEQVEGVRLRGDRLQRGVD